MGLVYPSSANYLSFPDSINLSSPKIIKKKVMTINGGSADKVRYE